MNVFPNAKFALVIAEAEKDQSGNENKDSWQNFLLNIPQTLRHSKKIEAIHDNVWLINLESELPVLSTLIQLCSARSIHIRLLFLAEFPDWIKYPPAATETVSQTTP